MNTFNKCYCWYDYVWWPYIIHEQSRGGRITPAGIALYRGVLSLCKPPVKWKRAEEALRLEITQPLDYSPSPFSAGQKTLTRSLTFTASVQHLLKPEDGYQEDGTHTYSYFIQSR